MSRLVLSEPLLSDVRLRLLASPEETCAVLLARVVLEGDRVLRFVVHNAEYPVEEDYDIRSEVAARLKPAFVARVTKRAKHENSSLVFVHSHPFPLNEFSLTDDKGERVLSEFLTTRLPGNHHAAMLVTPEVTIARVLGSNVALRVTGIGQTLSFGRPPDDRATSEEFDRQIRMLGKLGQARLGDITVGIVGLGGTGSIVTQHLAHLGVTRFMLIDPDTVEQTNLNRLVGAGSADIGRDKVELAEDNIRRIRPDAKVTTFRESVLLAKTASRLLDVDFIFGCTDSQGSRSILNQLAYQFLVPLIDMGVSIVVRDGRIAHMAARTNMLAPCLGCFVCGQLLDPEAVRVDLLTDFERAADPYVIGFNEPAPAVMSLNGTIASMAVTMFLGAVLGMGSKARFINYDGISGVARAAAIPPHSKCYVCSSRGAFAQADAWPLPGRLK